MTVSLKVYKTGNILSNDNVMVVYIRLSEFGIHVILNTVAVPQQIPSFVTLQRINFNGILRILKYLPSFSFKKTVNDNLQAWVPSNTLLKKHTNIVKSAINRYLLRFPVPNVYTVLL